MTSTRPLHEKAEVPHAGLYDISEMETQISIDQRASRRLHAARRADGPTYPGLLYRIASAIADCNGLSMALGPRLHREGRRARLRFTLCDKNGKKVESDEHAAKADARKYGRGLVPLEADPACISGLARGATCAALLHPQKALDRILAAAVRSTRADSGSFILINPEHRLPRHRGEPQPERARPAGEAAPGRRHHRLGRDHRAAAPAPAMCARRKRYVSINARVRSEMAVPVEMRGQVIGLLNVDSTQVDAFSDARRGPAQRHGARGRAMARARMGNRPAPAQGPAAHQPGRYRPDDHRRDQPSTRSSTRSRCRRCG